MKTEGKTKVETESVLRRLQKTELMILLKFNEICKKYHLVYYLCAGTLLGAVRHKGFIPWDDDVDVCMPYRDYLTFLKVAQKELGEKYFLQTLETDKNFCAPFAKIRLNNSTFLDSKFKKRNINHGIWIDIFPLSYTTKESVKKKQVLLKISKVLQMDDLIKSNPQELKLEHGAKSIIAARMIQCIIPFKLRKHLSKKIVNVVCNSKPKEWVCEIYGSTDMVFPSDIFNKVKYLEFEKELLPVPNSYEKYLIIRYGDYMQLPPEDQREGVHADIIDFENPYSVVAER